MSSTSTIGSLELTCRSCRWRPANSSPCSGPTVPGSRRCCVASLACCRSTAAASRSTASPSTIHTTAPSSYRRATPDRDGLPGLPAVPEHDCRGERGVRAARHTESHGIRHESRRWRGSNGSASPITPSTGRAQLSGGQAQRVALARALARTPVSCCSTSRSPPSMSSVRGERAPRPAASPRHLRRDARARHPRPGRCLRPRRPSA